MAHQGQRPNVVLISVVSGLIGAGIALLLAPKSGRETRQKLQSAASTIKHKARENYEQLRNQAKDTMQSASEMRHKITGAITPHKNKGEKNQGDTSGDTSASSQSSAPEQ